MQYDIYFIEISVLFKVVLYYNPNVFYKLIIHDEKNHILSSASILAYVMFLRSKQH